MEIYPGVHQITATFVNLYLIVEEKECILIDAGLKGSGRKVLELLKSLGREPASLTDVIITHADGDHYGGLAALETAVPLTAWAQPLEAEAIRLAKSSRALKPQGIARLFFSLVAPLFKSDPARIDRTLNGSETFPCLGGLNVLATPGHTPGHISLFSPSTGILFAGDSIRIQNGAPQPSASGNTWDSEKAAQ